MPNDLGGVVFNDCSAEVLDAMHDADCDRHWSGAGNRRKDMPKTWLLLTLATFATASPTSGRW